MSNHRPHPAIGSFVAVAALACFVAACDADSLPDTSQPARLTPPEPRAEVPTAPASDAADSTAHGSPGARPDATPRFEAAAAGEVAPLPESISRALQTDERVLDCPQGTRGGVSQFERGWVAVHRVQLDGRGPDDWVLAGRHSCLRAGDAVHWWVYLDDGDGPVAAMRGEVATAVRVLPALHHGVRDLELEAVAGNGAPLTSTLAYDGQAYANAAGERSD